MKLSGAGQHNRTASYSVVLFDVKRFALHDGPGIRTTLFVKGCPLACRWCHNPESQRPTPELLFHPDRCIGCNACAYVCSEHVITLQEAPAVTDHKRCTACAACVSVCPTRARSIVGRIWTLDETLDEIEKDILFYDQSGGGVTLSGGEPLTQPEFAAAFLEECHLRGLHTAVDTCGVAPAAVITCIADNTDLFLFDIKGLDDEMHQRTTGLSNNLVLENARLLDELGKQIWIRVPLIPGINDDEHSLADLGRFVTSMRSVDAIQILPYNPSGEEKRHRLGRADGREKRPEAHWKAATVAADLLRQHVGCAVTIGG